MHFELNADQQRWQQQAIEFAQAHLDEPDAARESDGEFSRESWRKCAEFGVQALPVPREYGGRGESLVTTVAVLEGLGYGCRDQGLLFSIGAHLWANAIALIEFGTPAQRERYLPRLASGAWIGANATSEPEAGSDLFSMQTSYKKTESGFVLEGGKTFCSNGPVADLFVAFATRDPALGAMGISSFLIESTTPGLIRGREPEKLGMRTSPMCDVGFAQCAIGAEALLGRECRGADVFRAAIQWERAAIQAGVLGAMRRQLEEGLAHATRRRQFGKPIGKFQAVANRLVEMKLRLETARLLVYKAAWLKDQGRDIELESALCKLYVGEASVQSSLDAVQIHGARGYMREFPCERQLRDAVGGTLYGGTSEIQRNTIARMLGL